MTFKEKYLCTTKEAVAVACRTDLLTCQFCPYQTIQKSNLKLHEATHTRSPGSAGRAGRGGRPAGRQTRRILDHTDQQIEEFIREVERDQGGPGEILGE